MYLKMKWKCITLFIIVHETLCLFCTPTFVLLSHLLSANTYTFLKKPYDDKVWYYKHLQDCMASQHGVPQSTYYN